MKHINFLHKTFCLFIPLLLLALNVPLVRAQGPTPQTPRDVLIQAITGQAQEDEKQGTKESTEGLNLLFGEQAKQVGMSLSEVKKIYEDAYSAAVAVRPWWESWLPNLGWIAAIAAILIAAFRGVIEDMGKLFFNSLGATLYNRFARYKPFWMLSLRRYKAALYEKHHELKLPFRPGRPLEMKEVYVPVKVSGKGVETLTNASHAIEKYKKLVVLGAPGVGKSILLRHEALIYAERELDEPLVPVLVELNRLNDAGTNMFEQLAAILKQNDFPNGENFLKAWLKTGQLLLMFDGLDEVNSDRRERVTSGIRDLLAEYPQCHAIVTCRTQVYRGEFADWADQTLEVAEFSDQQIQRFLFAWQKELPQAKSVEHLLTSLTERPRIMALARNPLMLTIIAFLYADTALVLPHSRAEFYNTAVKVMLGEWKGERSNYDLADKLLVMRHLALFIQDTAWMQGGMAIDRKFLFREVKYALPTLVLKDDDVRPLLQEILTRSGLLLELDSGLKYQFAYLTLQEFFAAQALGDNPDYLMQLYFSNPDTWRETVKLWCGLGYDCTRLLMKIRIIDQLLVYECLAESPQIDPELADQLIEELKALILADDVDEVLLHTFANIAADPRPLGHKAYGFLVTIASDANAPIEQVESAAKTLAFTNLPNVGEIVSKLAESNPNIRPFAVSMGDMIIPYLTNTIASGNVWALDILHHISTQLAVKTLISALWQEHPKIQRRAAWCLASLLPQPEIEKSLRDVKLTIEQRKAEQIKWIWDPFNEPATSSLPLITGRIAYLLHNTPDLELPTFSLPCDLRLSIPLSTIVAQGTQLDIKKYFGDHDTTPLTSMLVSLQTRPSEDNWRNLFRPEKYVFYIGQHARVMNLLLSMLLLLNLGGIYVQISNSNKLLAWDTAVAVLVGIFIITLGLFGKIWMLRLHWTIEKLGNQMLSALWPTWFAFLAIVGHYTGNWQVYVLVFLISLVLHIAWNFYRQGLILLILPISFLGYTLGGSILSVIFAILYIIIFGAIDGFLNTILGLLFVYYPTTLLYTVVGMPYTILFWLVWIGSFCTLYLIGKQKEHRAANPLLKFVKYLSSAPQQSNGSFS